MFINHTLQICDVITMNLTNAAILLTQATHPPPFHEALMQPVPAQKMQTWEANLHKPFAHFTNAFDASPCNVELSWINVIKYNTIANLSFSSHWDYIFRCLRWI